MGISWIELQWAAQERQSELRRAAEQARLARASGPVGPARGPGRPGRSGGQLRLALFLSRLFVVGLGLGALSYGPSGR